MSSRPALLRGSSWAACTHPSGAGGRARRSSPSLSSSYLPLDVLVAQLLARARSDAVDREPPRELCDPGANGLVVAQPFEVLEGAGEDFLEDVLCVVGAQAEALRRDRKDVAREARDELGP